MNLQTFINTSYWKTYILGKPFSGIVARLGEATDGAVGKESIKKFGDIEVGFDECGLAYYCQIDLNENQKLTPPYESWPVYGGMNINKLKKVLDGLGLNHSVNTSKTDPEFEEITTESGVIFSFAKPESEFRGKGLVNVRASV